MCQLLSAAYTRSLTNEAAIRKEIAEGIKKSAMDGCSSYIYVHKDGEIGATITELNHLDYRVTKSSYGFLSPETVYKISW